MSTMEIILLIVIAVLLIGILLQLFLRHVTWCKAVKSTTFVCGKCTTELEEGSYTCQKCGINSPCAKAYYKSKQ